MGISSGSKNSGKDGNLPSGRRKRALPTPPAKPTMHPTKKNPFPAKGPFRLGVYKIVEEKDDYLICEGYDPNAKDPFSEITPGAFRKIDVAKPPLLQRTAWENGKEATIAGVVYTYEYSDDEKGVRTAHWTDENDQEQEREERIDLPYMVDDYLVAVQLRQDGQVDGIDADNEGGARLSWMDFNVSGRHWQGPTTANAQVAILVSQDDDTLTVTPKGGTSPDDDVVVAKSYLLRRSPFDGDTIDGISYTYISATVRVVDDGTREWTQEISSPYALGDEVVIRPVNGHDLIGDSLADVEWIQADSGQAWIGDRHPSIRGILDGALSSGGTATLSVSKWTDSWVDSTRNEAVAEGLGVSTPIALGSVCWAEWERSRGIYLVTSVEC